MGDASAVAATLLVVVLLTAEAGLLIGVLLPSSSLVLGLGALAGAGAVPPSVAALSAAGATVLGAALGHRTATQGGGGALLSTDGIIGRLLPARIRAVGDRLSAPWVDAVGHRPVRAAAAAQFIAGARTLAPRIAAQAGVPLPIMLRGTAPAALLWSSSLVATGALASSALTRLNDAVAMLSVLVVVGATGVLIHRRKGGARRGRGQLQPHEHLARLMDSAVADAAGGSQGAEPALLRRRFSGETRAGCSSQAEDEAQGGINLAQSIEAEVPGRLPQAPRIHGTGLLSQQPGSGSPRWTPQDGRWPRGRR
jgi:membrane protein DedA with SNARE-associated domain